jgi:hypothetical protein
MATLTNVSSHIIPLGGLTLQPGKEIEDFDEGDAEKLKSSLFYRAGWLRIEPTAKAE